jgi:hypothetical protein
MIVNFPAGERRTDNALDLALRGKTDLFDEPLDRRRNGFFTHGASPNRGLLAELDDKKLCHAKTRN